MLGVTLVVAGWFMHDLGFTPQRGASPVAEVRTVIRGSIDGGFRNPPVRWLMLAAPFTAGRRVLRLLCRPAVPAPALRRPERVRHRRPRGGDLRRRPDRRRADRVARSAAVPSPHRRAPARRRPSTSCCSSLIGLTSELRVALVLLAAWALVFAIEAPLRQAFINGLIPSEQRATVLSFDSLMGSAGGVSPSRCSAGPPTSTATARRISSRASPGARDPVRLPRPPRGCRRPIEAGRPRQAA